MNRIINAHTPMGSDLLFSALNGREEISRLFDFTLELKSLQRGIAIKSLLGQSITLEMAVEGNATRYLNAQCSHFQSTGKIGRYYVYEARLRPWLWYASRRSDYKIFQQMTVPEIVLDVLGKNYPFPVDNRLTASYRTWDYNVQYRETDFNFVSRLMEHEGIYYYFEHAMGEHTLVLCDGLNAHSPFPGYAAIPFYMPDSAHTGEDYFDTWAVGQAIDSGAYHTDDYDFTKPAADLSTGRSKPRPHPHADYEIYDYPGGYTETDDGDRYSRVRMEELQADHETIQGFGEVRGAAPGRLFTLKRHPRADQNREYLITGAHYTLRDNSYEADSNVGTLTWRVNIDALPSSETYRPQRLTPKPRSMGPETAVVVGPPGEEIYTDEYGRVKVQFHWDRYGKLDDQSSCWIRVSHPWAGSNYGAIHIPRIGQEVIVDFLGGDPDYPIITGRVYNAMQMPPWTLPANKTQSGILTRSSKGGAAGAGQGAGVGDANALRFEDKKGEEQLWLHAQKDQLTEVEHDEDKWVGNDRRKTIDRDETTQVHRHRTETVDGNETITIHQNRTERVDLNEQISIGMNRTEDVGINESVTIGANRSVTIGVNKSETVGAMKTETIGAAKLLTIGALYQTSVGAAMNTSVALAQGEQVGLEKVVSVGKDYHINVGKNYVLEAGDSITLKVGASVLVMKKDGTITLNGHDLITNMTGEHISKSSGNMTLKGAKILEN